MTLAARMWRGYLHPYWGRMAAAFVLMVIEGSTLAVLSWMLKPLFDRVFLGGDTDAIGWVGGAIFALFVVRAVTLILNPEGQEVGRLIGDAAWDGPEAKAVLDALAR